MIEIDILYIIFNSFKFLNILLQLYIVFFISKIHLNTLKKCFILRFKTGFPAKLMFGNHLVCDTPQILSEKWEARMYIVLVLL